MTPNKWKEKVACQLVILRLVLEMQVVTKIGLTGRRQKKSTANWLQTSLPSRLFVVHLSPYSSCIKRLVDESSRWREPTCTLAAVFDFASQADTPIQCRSCDQSSLQARGRCNAFNMLWLGCINCNGQLISRLVLVVLWSVINFSYSTKMHQDSSKLTADIGQTAAYANSIDSMTIQDKLCRLISAERPRKGYFVSDSSVGDGESIHNRPVPSGANHKRQTLSALTKIVALDLEVRREQQNNGIRYELQIGDNTDQQARELVPKYDTGERMMEKHIDNVTIQERQLNNNNNKQNRQHAARLRPRSRRTRRRRRRVVAASEKESTELERQADDNGDSLANKLEPVGGKLKVESYGRKEMNNLKGGDGMLRWLTSDLVTTSGFWRTTRSFRSRPKLGRKITRKITPTRVLIGAHLGSWAYKEYSNWTSRANASTVNETVALITSVNTTNITPPLSPSSAKPKWEAASLDNDNNGGASANNNNGTNSTTLGGAPTNSSDTTRSVTKLAPLAVTKLPAEPELSGADLPDDAPLVAPDSTPTASTRMNSSVAYDDEPA